MNPVGFSTVERADEAGWSPVAMIAEAGFDGAEALREVAEAHGLAIPSIRGGPTFRGLFGAASRAVRDRAVQAANTRWPWCAR